jgi:hypothetical protein
MKMQPSWSRGGRGSLTSHKDVFQDVECVAVVVAALKRNDELTGNLSDNPEANFVAIDLRLCLGQC